jgi:hypothetical protein
VTWVAFAFSGGRRSVSPLARSDGGPSGGALGDSRRVFVENMKNRGFGGSYIRGSWFDLRVATAPRLRVDDAARSDGGPTISRRIHN